MGDVAPAPGPARRRRSGCWCCWRPRPSARTCRSLTPTTATRSPAACRPRRGRAATSSSGTSRASSTAGRLRSAASHVLPALAGLFVGAPLLARELEHGTHRFAWTQAITRRRWLLSKTALLAAGTVLAGAAASALVMWWRGPFDTLEGRMGAERLRPRGCRRPGLRAVRARAGRARRAVAPPHRRRDDGDARRLRLDAADRAHVPAAELPARRCIAPSSPRTSAARRATGC